ncbi:MAG: substrate-binding domain-containing protein [Eubacteriaceae bacterium]|nr:substrate-binding domain-containing protein [Eubacteriaceae bacterium]
MRRFIAYTAALCLLLSFTACTPKGQSGAGGDSGPDEREIILSTTTSVNDSGLLDYLQPYLKEDKGITLNILAQGSGQALATAAAGDADAVIAHSPAAEKEFVANGSGTDRTEFMHNFYVIVGPSDDPAGLSGAADTADAMSLILASGNKFVSRGDESGTHTKEKSLWALTDVDYEADTENYMSIGKGMGDTLVTASEVQGYTLTDLSTFLSMKDKLDLEVAVDQGSDLKNVYSVILVAEQSGKEIKTDDARDFMDWLLSEKALGLIAEYGKDKYGQALFFIGQ